MAEPLLRVKDLVKRFPVKGGLLQKRGGTVRHDAVVWGYGPAADALGVDIIQNCEVTAVKRGANGAGGGEGFADGGGEAAIAPGVTRLDAERTFEDGALEWRYPVPGIRQPGKIAQVAGEVGLDVRDGLFQPGRRNVSLIGHGWKRETGDGLAFPRNATGADGGGKGEGGHEVT